MSTKLKILLSIAVLVALIFVGFILRYSRVLPIESLPTTQWIPAEEWGELALRGGLPGKGWVLLPKNTEGPLHHAAVPAR